jgi:hypothetical protein
MAHDEFGEVCLAFYLKRAEEARAMGKAMCEGAAKETFLSIAAEYLLMADMVRDLHRIRAELKPA